LPGNLCNNGVQHDNDYASVADIQILQTAQEILTSGTSLNPKTELSQMHVNQAKGAFHSLEYSTIHQSMHKAWPN
jgi:hypothetical protein